MREHWQIDPARAANYFSRYGVIITAVILVIMNIIYTPNFFSINTLWNLVIQSSIVALMTLGMTIVITTAGIDISVGAAMAVCGAVLAKYMPCGIAAALALTLLTGIVLGMINGYIIGRFNIQPIIVTLATMMSYRGLAQMIGEGRKMPVEAEVFNNLSYYKVFGTIPVQLFIVLLFALVIYILMRKTTFGRQVEAIGGNEKAARIAGVNTFRVILVSYAICGLAASFGAILEAARLSSVDVTNMGKYIEFDVVAAVAIGGTFLSGGKARILNSLIGAWVMRLITITVNMNNIEYAYSLIIKTLVIILAVAVSSLLNRSEGKNI